MHKFLNEKIASKYIFFFYQRKIHGRLGLITLVIIEHNCQLLIETSCHESSLRAFSYATTIHFIGNIKEQIIGPCPRYGWERKRSLFSNYFVLESMFRKTEGELRAGRFSALTQKCKRCFWILNGKTCILFGQKWAVLYNFGKM